jgi:hypothetical protein
LKVALENQIETTRSIPRWLATTVEIDVTLALALAELGFDARQFDPRARGPGAFVPGRPRAAPRTQEVAEARQATARRRSGIHHAPGC